jgi:dihydrodipicolinate synthase/N-acetylneuraminate lyase
MIAKLKDGDISGARRIYDDVIQPLVSVIFAPPVRNYRARVKEALVALEVLDAAHVRAPLLSLDPAERAMVREAVARAQLKAPAGAIG